MIDRRLVLALPVLAVPVRAQAVDDLADELANVLVACWQARGVRFTADQVRGRMAGRTGKAALLALAGAADTADGGAEEIAVEILWEAGHYAGAGRAAMLADLARRQPLLLLTRDGRARLLLAVSPTGLVAADESISWADAALIGRPVIAGA
jgi:hypothetical protein